MIRCHLLHLEAKLSLIFKVYTASQCKYHFTCLREWFDCLKMSKSSGYFLHPCRCLQRSQWQLACVWVWSCRHEGLTAESTVCEDCWVLWISWMRSCELLLWTHLNCPCSLYFFLISIMILRTKPNSLIFCKDHAVK